VDKVAETSHKTFVWNSFENIKETQPVSGLQKCEPL
jgi:hypothetical protein